jgi:DNA topoisomerase-3
VQLIIAEKPSVARDLARVLGIRPEGRHWFEGGGRVITWCVGHLVELEEPAAYDPRWRSWRLDTLPMLPEELRLRPAKHAGAQLRAVTRLLAERRFETVVNACDAGREGELIFRYVYRYAGGGPPVLRLWISSLTDEAIRRGLASLRPGAQFEPLGDAARSRSEADWLVGMNATRAVTARAREAGGEALYSIGRVQTPTLAMLVAREQAIRAFVPRPYWEVRAELRTAAGQRFAACWRHGATGRVATAELAGAICERDRAAAARVERIRARTVREPPPLLFDLTSLQRTANRRFGFSAARTLELAQALYERHKLLTYPRTDSRHLSSDVVAELPAVFDALAAVPEYAVFAAALRARPPRPGRRVVDDAKVSDHHAIIPTPRRSRLDALERDERRLYDLVARRFLGVFFPDAEFAVSEVWICVGEPVGEPPRAPGGERGEGGERGGSGAGAAEAEAEADASTPILERLPPMPDRYLARGRVRLVAGWQEVAGIEPGAAGGAAGGAAERRGSDGEPEGVLPPLAEGQPLAGAYTPVGKQTRPPPRYTEATLLAAMESAGKSIDDEALRQAMKDCGLGTPATRAAIIETLLRRDYVLRAKQHLVPTETGIGLIQALPAPSLASAELTGQWEARLARIARGEESRAAFMADIARYVRDTVDAVRAASPPPAPPGGSSGSSGGAWRESRRARKPRRTRGRARRPGGRAAAAAPAAARATAPAPATAARATAPAIAARAASPATAARAAAAAAAAELGCPRCRAGTLIAGSRGWGCSRWREGCRFVVWFQTAGRRLSAAQLRDLVTRGKTRKARFVPTDGAPAVGRLVLDPTADAGAARFVPA